MGKSSRNNRRRCMWFGCTTAYLLPDINICANHAVRIKNRIEELDQQAIQRQMPAFKKRMDEQLDEQIERLKANKPQRDDFLEQAPEHWVYYVKNGDQIKIGFTTNLSQRLRQYPPNVEILGVEYGDEDLEKQRHEQFSAYLAYGREWFRDTQEIRDHITTLPPMTHLNIKRMRRGQANQASRVQPRYWSGK